MIRGFELKSDSGFEEAKWGKLAAFEYEFTFTCKNFNMKEENVDNFKESTRKLLSEKSACFLHVMAPEKHEDEVPIIFLWMTKTRKGHIVYRIITGEGHYSMVLIGQAQEVLDNDFLKWGREQKLPDMQDFADLVIEHKIREHLYA